MKSHFSVWLLVLASFSAAIAQSDTLRLDSMFTINKTVVALDLDIFNNIYIADNEGFIYKYDSVGNLLNTYSNNRFGPPDNVYYTTNRQLTAYYGSMRVLRILDRLLTPVSEIDFKRLGLPNASVVYRGNLDGYFWFYDLWEYKIRKADAEGRISVESQTMSSDFPGFKPFKLFEMDNFLFAVDAQYGIFAFNSFGGLEFNINQKDISDVFADESRLFYTINDELTVYNFRYRIIEKSYIIPLESKRNISTIRRDYCFIHNKDFCIVSKIKNK